MEKATKATYTTGAAMAKNFEVYAGPGKIEVRTIAGYGVIYIDKKRQKKAAIPGSDWAFTVDPGPHHVAVEMGGQLFGNKVVDVPAEGDAVMVIAIDQPATEPAREETAENPKPEEPEPAAEEPTAEEPTAEEPAEQPTEEPAQEPVEEPEPDQPDPDPVKPPEPYMSIKVETVKLLIDELRDVAGFLEELLPSQKSEAEG